MILALASEGLLELIKKKREKKEENWRKREKAKIDLYQEERPPSQSGEPPLIRH